MTVTYFSTLRDVLRYATTRFNSAGLFFGHGSTNAFDEAAYLLLHTLKLPLDRLDPFLDARLLPEEVAALLKVVERRAAERVPAAYITHEAWLGSYRFYVDERVIVPRSFIGELLESHFGGEGDNGGPLIEDPAEVKSVLDLCTGSGCLAVLASRQFPNARIEAIDVSKDALEVAARNIAGYGLQERVSLHRGDLFKPIGEARYDLVISNPPYVDEQGMANLPRECRAEPKLAFAGGADGLDIIRRILKEAGGHLTPHGGLLCEIGRGRAAVEAAFPHLPLLWLDTEDSEGEVFWIGAGDL
jgi:ribosomal protein L3 glutamine methyltransferase